MYAVRRRFGSARIEACLLTSDDLFDKRIVNAGNNWWRFLECLASDGKEATRAIHLDLTSIFISAAQRMRLRSFHPELDPLATRRYFGVRWKQLGELTIRPWLNDASLIDTVIEIKASVRIIFAQDIANTRP